MQHNRFIWHLTTNLPPLRFPEGIYSAQTIARMDEEILPENIPLACSTWFPHSPQSSYMYQSSVQVKQWLSRDPRMEQNVKMVNTDLSTRSPWAFHHLRVDLHRHQQISSFLYLRQMMGYHNRPAVHSTFRVGVCGRCPFPSRHRC